eukprot:scpid66443/ scgid27705/ PiggyBac transposable element-derived protein 4
MLVSILLLPAMGTRVQQPEVRNYWSGHRRFRTQRFTKMMARNQFQLLVTVTGLHFVDKEEADLYDLFYKMKKFVDRVITNFRQAYTPLREASVDEQMIAYKGRLAFKQYMPAKPVKWGMKAFVLAESTTGHACDWFIYTGKDQTADNDTRRRGEQVVSRLVEHLQPGYIVYMDNYYTSRSHFVAWKEKRLGAVGTVLAKRKGLPEEIRTKHKKGTPTRHWPKMPPVSAAVVRQKAGKSEQFTLQLLSTLSSEIGGVTPGRRCVHKPSSVASYNA